VGKEHCVIVILEGVGEAEGVEVLTLGLFILIDIARDVLLIKLVVSLK